MKPTPTYAITTVKGAFRPSATVKNYPVNSFYMVFNSLTKKGSLVNKC